MTIERAIDYLDATKVGTDTWAFEEFDQDEAGIHYIANRPALLALSARLTEIEEYTGAASGSPYRRWRDEFCSNAPS